MVSTADPPREHAAPRCSAPPAAIDTWAASTAFFLVIWLALFAFGGSSLLRDPGTFWHVALGERFLQTGTQPTHDTFTFTFTGQRWLSLQWLGEAAMAAAYRAGGWDTLVLLTVTALAATYAWLASRLMRAGLHWLPTAVLSAIVIAASSHHFHARPHVATIAFLGLTMACLCDVESGRARLRRLWWLVPLFALWTNVHGGVLGGLITVALAAGGWCVAAMLGRPGPLRRRRDWVALALILVGSAAALLVNPYGLETPRAWLKIMAMPLPELIQEHRPLSLWRPEGWMVIAVAAGYLGTLVSAVRGACGSRASMNAGHASRVPPCQDPTPFRMPLVTWLIPLVWLMLAVTRVRHAPLFAITAAVAMAAMLPNTRFAAWLAKWELFEFGEGRPSPQPSPQRGGGAMKLTLVAVAAIALPLIALGLQSLGVRVPVVGRGWAQHDRQQWPVELLADLKRIEAERPGRRIFNALDFGGFLSFHTPGLQTFIDDRCELFGTEFLSAYADAEARRPERLDDWAGQYDFDVALVRTGTPFDHHLRGSANWRIVHASDAATLFRRTDLQSVRP